MNFSSPIGKHVLNDISCSITRSCYDAINHDIQKNPDEPSFIARMVMHLSHGICDSLSVYAPNYDVVITTMFCHQRPIVEFNGKRCELGDILFVFDEKDKQDIKGNSLLLQAKKTDKNPVIPDNENQQELYSTFPKFNYFKPKLKDSNGNPIECDINPKEPCSGAQYLLLKEPFNLSDSCVCALATPVGQHVEGKDSLAQNLVDLLSFKTGRTYEPENGDSQDDWSNMVHDLLERGKIKNANYFEKQTILYIDASKSIITTSKNVIYREYGALMNVKKNGIKNAYRIYEAASENLFADSNTDDTSIDIENNQKVEDEEKPFVIFYIYAEKKEEQL
ncbi:MAG: hypothetical protein IKR40_04585 [Treponema sp.]|nr:hypothetical protein [Treponema sp.]